MNGVPMSVCSEGNEPQSFAGSLGEPRCLFVPAAFGFPGLVPVGCWGSPWLPQHRGSTPHTLPAAPSPRSDPRRAACPFKSGPADITAGGGGRWPGSRLRGGCRTRLRSAPACCSGDPGPGRPLPPPPDAQTPGSAPGLARAPVLIRGAPGLPLLSLLLRVSLSPCLSLSLSLSLAQGVWVSSSLSLGPVSVSLSLCLLGCPVCQCLAPPHPATSWPSSPH